ncbi:Phage related protein [[Clostridium] sordellii]|uniref:metallophosphoesterase family protein n=1 Tax=Paraclostridium sordellii TaxID=1505 RepID=UPI0005E1D720|nr:metallophosphoesterase family protein [Paeniclostridium sordellii]CEQ01607.1 Phage related protein [[Clostridium] sordellii] [Paeniclostridium sordellii]
MNNKKEIIDLVLNKLNKESDMSWKEVNDYLGLNYSNDHLRKISYGIKLYNDYLHEQGIENATDEQLIELNEKITELKKERTKNQDLRTYINRMCREDARREKILEYAQDIANQLNKQLPLITESVELNNIEDNEGILTLSDLHIGLETNNHWNKFDMDILLQRLNYLKEKTITYAKQNNIKKLNILCIGDIINGLLHTTTRIENQEDVADQTVHAAEILAEFIYSLAETKLFSIDIYYSVGNHGRITPNKSDSLDGENFEYFIKYILKSRCRNMKNVIFKENKYDKELIYFECLGWKIAACHGDKFGNKNNIVQRITSMIGEVPNYVCIGHLHHSYMDTIGNCELIINGSLSGTDSYAKNLGLVSRPSQNLLIINKDIGKLCLYNIYLDCME